MEIPQRRVLTDSNKPLLIIITEAVAAPTTTTRSCCLHDGLRDSVHKISRSHLGRTIRGRGSCVSLRVVEVDTLLYIRFLFEDGQVIFPGLWRSEKTMDSRITWYLLYDR